MSTIAEDIAAEVARIEPFVSCVVTGDPREAASTRGLAVLVEPPVRDYNRRMQEWTLVILRVTTDLGIDTTKAISEVLDELEASPLPIESARPGARRFAQDRAYPAYFVTYTTA